MCMGFKLAYNQDKIKTEAGRTILNILDFIQFQLCFELCISLAKAVTFSRRCIEMRSDCGLYRPILVKRFLQRLNHFRYPYQ